MELSSISQNIRRKLNDTYHNIKRLKRSRKFRRKFLILSIVFEVLFAGLIMPSGIVLYYYYNGDYPSLINPQEFQIIVKKHPSTVFWVEEMLKDGKISLHEVEILEKQIKECVGNEEYTKSVRNLYIEIENAKQKVLTQESK